MANPTWPSTLPEPVLDSISYSPWQNTIRSQMDSGPPKMRRRFTAAGEDVTVVLILTPAQKDALDTFIRTTLKDVLPFDWYEFRAAEQTVATYRFKQRPAYTPWGAEYWQATLSLDLLGYS